MKNTMNHSRMVFERMKRSLKPLEAQAFIEELAWEQFLRRAYNTAVGDFNSLHELDNVKTH